MSIVAGTLIDRVLALARAQLEEGVRESGGPNAGVPSTRYMGGRCEPWCGHFVSWLWRECGQPLPGDVVPDVDTPNPIALVAIMERELGARQWLRQSPERGDIAFFAKRQGSDAGHGRHVGIIERVNNTTITTIEGNSGDKVQRVTYLRMKLNMLVTSYGRVPETPRPPVEVPDPLCAG